jgi:hypothetical protein
MGWLWRWVVCAHVWPPSVNFNFIPPLHLIRLLFINPLRDPLCGPFASLRDHPRLSLCSDEPLKTTKMLSTITSKNSLRLKGLAAATRAPAPTSAPAPVARAGIKGPTIFDKLGGRDNVTAVVDKVTPCKQSGGSSLAPARRSLH